MCGNWHNQSTSRRVILLASDSFCGERRQSAVCTRVGVGSTLSLRLEPSESLPLPFNTCSLSCVTEPVRRGWKRTVWLREATLYNSVSELDSDGSTVAGWATSSGWPLLRTGYVLVLARVSLSPCTFLVTDFLFLSARVNRFRISRALVTLNRSPIGDTKRSLRSGDQTDLGQISKSVCSRPYSTSQVSLSISVCDILTHAFIEFVLSELLLYLSLRVGRDQPTQWENFP